MPRFGIMGYAGERKAIQINCAPGFATGKSPWILTRDAYPDSLGFWKTQAFSKADGHLKAPSCETTSYLLCYHEVIAEWLTGTNGSQQKSEDHVQKPPANNKNKPISSQQDETIENSATRRARRQSNAHKLGLQPLFMVPEWFCFRDKFDTNPFCLPTVLCQG